MGLGWGNLAGGIGELIGKVSTYIPGQVERLRNERDTLIKERNHLLAGVCDVKASKRMDWISNRLDTINRLLGNKAKD